MKKPENMEKLAEMICLWLGAAFIFFGLLSHTGILKPRSDSSIQDPAVMACFFSAIGFVFAAVGLFFRIIDARKVKLYSELRANGTQIKGTVEKVYLQWYTRYGTRSPYRVQYSYTYQNKTYHHKSCLLWEKPDLKNGDMVTIYVNNFGKSTIQL